MQEQKPSHLVTALNKLPARLSAAAVHTVAAYPEMAKTVEEIRLREGGRMTLVAANYTLPVTDIFGKFVYAADFEMTSVLKALCDNAVYTYEDDMMDGMFVTPDGLRVTVAGTVRCEGGSVRAFKRIGSLVIRIPGKLVDCAGDIVPLMEAPASACGNPLSTLIYAPPGQGKTTLLRDLIRHLCIRYRGVVIDRRGELFDREAYRDVNCDFLVGYALRDGIDTAIRTLNAQVLFCDEIGAPEEAETIIATQHAGVSLIATAHGDSVASLLRRPALARLHACGVFSQYLGIRRGGDGFLADVCRREAVPICS